MSHTYPFFGRAMNRLCLCALSSRPFPSDQYGPRKRVPFQFATRVRVEAATS